MRIITQTFYETFKNEGDLSMAYLEFSTAGKHTYVYITEYAGPQEYSSRLEKRLLGLGRVDNALLKLVDWRKNKHLMPQIVEENFQDELDVWISKVAMKVQ